MSMEFYKIKDYSDRFFKNAYKRKIYLRLQDKVKTIAFHKTRAGLGDVVLSIPIFRALKRMFPKARIIYFGSYPSPLCDSLIESIPYIDDFVFEEQPFKEHILRDIPSFSKRYFKRFDLLVSGQIKLIESLRLWSAFPKFYISRNPLLSSWRLMDPRVYTEKDIHILCKMMLPIKIMGLEDIDYSAEIDVPEKYFSLSEAYLMGHKGPFISILPSSGNFHKNWAEDRYALLADRLARAGYTIILLSRTQEMDIVSRVKDKMASEAIVPILKQKEFGQDPIYNVGFLKRSLLAVSNDGGGLHLAALAGCPSVGLYGPSDPTKWGPLGERNIVIYKDMACSPCRFVNMQERIECELDRKCLKDISVDEVLEAVEFILGKRI